MIIRHAIPLMLVASMVMTACAAGGTTPAPAANPTQTSATESTLSPTDAPAVSATATPEAAASDPVPTATQLPEPTATSASASIGATETADARRQLRARIDVAVVLMGKGKQLLVTLVTPNVTDADKIVVTEVASGQPIAHDGYKHTAASSSHNFVFVLTSGGPVLKQGTKVRLTGPVVRNKLGADVPLDIEATVLEQ